MARWIDVNVANIHNWETGKRNPHVHHLPEVIDFLGYYPYPVANTVAGKLVPRVINCGCLSTNSPGGSMSIRLPLLGGSMGQSAKRRAGVES